MVELWFDEPDPDKLLHATPKKTKAVRREVAYDAGHAMLMHW